MFGLVQAVLGLILLTMIIPESPKWFYEKGKYKECQKVLDGMAKKNNKQMVSDVSPYSELGTEADGTKK